MFYSILGGTPIQKKELAAFFEDFNINGLISRARSLDRESDLTPLYQYMPESKEEIRFRRSVTEDLLNEAIHQAFSLYVRRIQEVKSLAKMGEFCGIPLQEKKYHLDELYHFHRALTELEQVLVREAKGFAIRELLDYISDYKASKEFQAWSSKVLELEEKIQGQTRYFSVSKNRVLVEDAPEEESVENRFARVFSFEEKKEEKTFDKRDRITLLEMRLAERIVDREKLDKPLSGLKKFQPDQVLMHMAEELPLYLSFFKVKKQLEEMGYEFCLPREGASLEIQEGFDLGMALQSWEKNVVSNSFQMREGEHFLVVTGANGGGKTTFARMLGQVVYLSQMGLLVPAREASLPFYDGIFSHFSKEESTDTGRGKLKEELERLAPLMQEQKSNVFVVLNELFTTAASYDAEVMGNRVIDHFLEKNCTGIYVTHIQGLAKERPGIVSLVAELAGDHHTRTFLMARKPADQGEYEDSIISKYDMIYDRMKEVVGGGK